MISFRTTIKCSLFEEKTRELLYHHTCGWGLSIRLNEQLAHEIIHGWSQLCAECSHVHACDHAYENPHELLKIFHENGVKLHEALADEKNRDRFPSYMSRDNVDTIVLDERRRQALADRDWKKVAELSWSLGYNAGRMRTLNTKR